MSNVWANPSHNISSTDKKCCKTCGIKCFGHCQNIMLGKIPIDIDSDRTNNGQDFTVFVLHTNINSRYFKRIDTAVSFSPINTYLTGITK